MAGTPPASPLPDLDSFKAATTVKWGIGKLSKKSARNNIGRIDLALQGYHDATSLHTKRRALAHLVKECRDWVSGRTGKKQSKALGKRMPVVKNLGALAFDWLKYVQFESLKHDKKVIFPGIGRRISPTQGLQPGYNAERGNYLSHNKQQMPVSGTYVHQATGAENKLIQANTLDPTTLPLNVQAVLNKNFAQLTDNDYQVYFNYLSGKGLIDGGMGRVWYMSKTERQAYMLVIQNGEFYKGYDTVFVIKPLRTIVYAIDQYGSTFACDAATIDVRADGLNHSTFNAGKDIICAGNMTLQFGKPTIDNGSGHYQPSRQQLHEAITMYHDAGLDLSKWNVGIHGVNGIDVFNANAFLADVNIPVLQSMGQAVLGH